MNYTFFTVGPSQLFPTVSKHMKNAIKDNIPSISHRGEQFKNIYKETQDSLRKLMDIPKNWHIFFISSGLEAMERIIQNSVAKSSLHFINGAFSKKFCDFSKKLKKHPYKIETDENKQFDYNSVKIPKDVELICITQNETSTGTIFPMDEIYKIKDKNPDKLIAIDIVSSAPYVKINWLKIDAAFFSVQKGFGLPAGLCVLLVNEKIIDKSKELDYKGYNIGTFHSFISLLDKETNYQNPETPNILFIYLLGQVCRDFLKIGIEKIRKDTEKKAELIYDFFKKHKIYEPYVKNADIRSMTTITIDVRGRSKEIIRRLAEKGIIAGSGYGTNKDRHIRIANFPAHRLTDVKKLLKYLR